MSTQITKTKTTSNSLRLLEMDVEKSTGKTADELRKKTLGELRVDFNRERGKDITFKNYKPFIGRGSVVERFLTKDDIDSILDDYLK